MSGLYSMPIARAPRFAAVITVRPSPEPRSITKSCGVTLAMSSILSTSVCGVGTQTTSLPAWPTCGSNGFCAACAQALAAPRVTTSAGIMKRTVRRTKFIDDVSRKQPPEAIAAAPDSGQASGPAANNRPRGMSPCQPIRRRRDERFEGRSRRQGPPDQRTPSVLVWSGSFGPFVLTVVDDQGQREAAGVDAAGVDRGELGRPLADHVAVEVDVPPAAGCGAPDVHRAGRAAVHSLFARF